MGESVAIRNGWGDAVLAGEVRPIAPRAWMALALAASCPAAMFLAELLPTEPSFRIRFGDDLAALLGLAKLSGVAGGLALGYLSLATCRPEGPYGGRMLAWLALAITYGAIFWFTLSIMGFTPYARYVEVVIVLVMFTHGLAFARESSFAKYAIVSASIGIVLLSLLSCGLVQSREEARRLECSNRLRMIATDPEALRHFQNEMDAALLASQLSAFRKRQSLIEGAQDNAKPAPSRRRWVPAR